jgi:hypothetical protein
MVSLISCAGSGGRKSDSAPIQGPSPSQESGSNQGQSPSTAEAVSPEKARLQSMYMDYLRQEGYGPSIDSDGDILFKAEGHSYYIIVTDDDLEFFQILYPNIWKIESEQERRKAGIAASHATRRTKTARVYLNSDGNNVSISAELFLEKPEDFKLFFSRMLRVLTTASSEFEGRM